MIDVNGPHGRLVEKMTAVTPVYSDPRLKDLAVQEAQRRGVALSELFCIAMAKFLRKPELAKVPRKRPGRRVGSGKHVAPAV
jgi:hypothetical protein